MFKFKLNQSG